MPYLGAMVLFLFHFSLRRIFEKGELQSRLHHWSSVLWLAYSKDRLSEAGRLSWRLKGGAA